MLSDYLHIFFSEVSVKIFCPDYGLPFHFLSRVFQRAVVLNLDKVQFIIYFYFMIYAFSILTKKSLPRPWSQRFPECFLLKLHSFSF